MFQVKQMLAAALLLQLFGMMIFCDAQKVGSPLLARRLLEENNVEGDVVEVDDFITANTGIQSDNSTMEVPLEEGFNQPGLFSEVVYTDETSEGNGRRNLLSCGRLPRNRAFRVHEMRIN